jgi:predicted Zn-dependent protease
MYQYTSSGLKFILVLLIALILACAVNPVTGKRQFMLLSESDEIQLGKISDAEIVKQYGVYPDVSLSEYITGIGMKMARLSHRPNLPYEFKVMDTPVINAFAIPGGYVYITRGILAYLNNEAELAGVMGHEIGHITARHSAEQYSKAELAQLGLGLGSVLSETFQKYAGIAQFGVGMLFLKFSRENESQSDELGVQYSTEAGYDATQMANFFRTLDRMSPSGNRDGLAEWFSTHPNPEGRAVTVEALAKQWRQKAGNQNLVIRRDEFLHHIDGIVFGDDPRQGYLENGIFYHPDLTFLFSIPADWKTLNTPTQVQIASPQEDAVILFTMDASASPEEAAAKFISDSKATVVSQNNTKVHGMLATALTADIQSQQEVLRVLVYFIKKDQNIFVFYGFTAQPAFETYKSNFQQTISSFNRLTDRNKINVQPDRVRLKTVTRTGLLKDILIGFKISSGDLDKMALLNGMQLTDSVPANTLIKIVEKGK